MKDSELQAIHNYSLGHDMTELSAPLVDNPSAEYQIFISKVLSGNRGTDAGIKDSVRYQRRVALLVHLVGLPKKTIEYPESVFNLIAPLVGKSSSAVRNYYYEHKKYIEDIYKAVEQYRDDPESVQAEAWPPLQRMVDETNLAINIINSKDK